MIDKEKQRAVPIEELRKKFFYDEASGKLYRAPVEVGCSGKDGRKTLNINNRHYQLHRVIWAVHHGEWPDQFIDHIDGDPSNNKIENLRLSTPSENQQNRKIQSNNRSGYKGVSVHSDNRERPYRASIMVKGERINLGMFHTPQEAHQVYCEAANKHHGEYARFS